MNDFSLWLFVGVVAVFLLTAAALDLRTRRLPNWLTVPMCIAGLIFHTVTAGWLGLGTAMGGFATGFSILLVLWLVGGGGGGDVKLMGALGAWLGPLLTLIVFLGSSVVAIGGMMVLFLISLMQNGYIQARGRYLVPRKAAASAGAAVAGDQAMAARRSRSRAMPYAVPVAISSAFVLVWHVLVRLA